MVTGAAVVGVDDLAGVEVTGLAVVWDAPAL
jgi:hypothetical protein